MNKNNENDSAIQARMRMVARIYHKDMSDEDDIEWITTKTGQHVPLIDGKAVGGPLKGKDFSEAKSSNAKYKDKSSNKPATLNYSYTNQGGNNGKRKASVRPKFAEKNVALAKIAYAKLMPDYEDKKLTEYRRNEIIRNMSKASVGMILTTKKLATNAGIMFRGEVADKGPSRYDPDSNTILFGKKLYGGTVYHELWHGIDNNYGYNMSPAEMSEHINSLVDLLCKEDDKLLTQKRALREHVTRNFETDGRYMLSCTQRLSTGKTFCETIIGERSKLPDLQTLCNMEEAAEKFDFGPLIAEDEDKPHFEEIKDAWNCISDIYNAMTYGQYSVTNFGHFEDNYWGRNLFNAGMEAFAEAAELKATNPYGYKLLKSLLPETVAAFDEIYEMLENDKIPLANKNRQ